MKTIDVKKQANLIGGRKRPGRAKFGDVSGGKQSSISDEIYPSNRKAIVSRNNYLNFYYDENY